MPVTTLNFTGGSFASPCWWNVRRHRGSSAADVFVFGEITTGADDLLAEIGDADDVRLHLDSTGGDAVAALALHDALKGRCSVGTIHHASSAAAIIALCADHRRIETDARMMIHASRSVAFATATGLREAANVTEVCDRRAFEILRERTSQPAAVVAHWLDGDDHWFDAEQAVAVGLAHEIIPAALPSLPSPSCESDDLRPGPTADEKFIFDLLHAAGRLHVHDRRVFIKNLCAWAACDQHVTTQPKN